MSLGQSYDTAEDALNAVRRIVQWRIANAAEVSVAVAANFAAPMQAIAQAFEQDPLCAVSLRMRHWDEQAKQMHVPLLDLEVLKAKFADPQILLLPEARHHLANELPATRQRYLDFISQRLG